MKMYDKMDNIEAENEKLESNRSDNEVLIESVDTDDASSELMNKVADEELDLNESMSKAADEESDLNEKDVSNAIKNEDDDHNETSSDREIKREQKKERRMRNAKKRHLLKRIVLTFIAAIFAISFLLPTILTMANSFMSSAEITTNYGVIFSKYKETEYGEKNTDYVAERVNLKLIPDMVDFSQYNTVLLKSPDYLIKFWNSVILTIPIMIFQILVALGAAYSFMRFRSRRREVLFFMYVAVMLMPFQVSTRVLASVSPLDNCTRSCL